MNIRHSTLKIADGQTQDLRRGTSLDTHGEQKKATSRRPNDSGSTRLLHAKGRRTSPDAQQQQKQETPNDTWTANKHGRMYCARRTPPVRSLASPWRSSANFVSARHCRNNSSTFERPKLYCQTVQTVCFLFLMMFVICEAYVLPRDSNRMVWVGKLQSSRYIIYLWQNTLIAQDRDHGSNRTSAAPEANCARDEQTSSSKMTTTTIKLQTRHSKTSSALRKIQETQIVFFLLLRLNSIVLFALVRFIASIKYVRVNCFIAGDDFVLFKTLRQRNEENVRDRFLIVRSRVVAKLSKCTSIWFVGWMMTKQLSWLVFTRLPYRAWWSWRIWGSPADRPQLAPPSRLAWSVRQQ